MFGLTTPQVNIWNLQKFYKKTSIQNICGAVLYDELLDRELLEQAINEEIRLQSGLRLKFTEESGTPVQYIEEYSFSEIEFAAFNSENDFKCFAEDFAAKPFQLINSQMCRFVRFELNGSSGVLVCASHLISDAWTFSILARDFYNIYCKLAANESIDLPERSYADCAKSEQDYLNSARYDKDKVFWEEYCTDKLEPSFIKMRQIPVDVTSAKRFTKQLTTEETSAVDSFCINYDVSQAVLFEAAVIAYLYRANRKNKAITIGIPVLNRNNSAEKNTIGMFISTMPLTVDVLDEDTAVLLCNKITECHSKIFRHQKYPYSHILQKLREKSSISGNPYDVMVSYQNAKTNINGRTWWFPNGYSETPFVMHIDNRDSTDRYTLTIDYQTVLFRQDGEISLLTDRILLIVRQMISDNTVKIKDLSILPASEYQQVIYNFNDTAVDYPMGKCVHELFSEQAAKNPDKIALAFEDKKFSYKQLDEMSNSLAHYLREERAIKPNDIVPVISKRSWHVVVAMLGIMKAGGAYMPVDPDYPKDRVDYMISEANCSISLNCEYGEILSINSVDLKTFDYDYNKSEIKNINKSEDTCYLIFTSGSTGKPKGALLRHYGLVNFINNNIKNFFQSAVIKNCNTILAVGSFIFDISVSEIILPLLNGQCTVIANDDAVNNADMMAKVISEYDIDMINATPTRLSYYFGNSAFSRSVNNIKIILTAGESLTSELFNKIRLNSNAKIYNGYGPTETTIGCSYSLAEDAKNITIGKPIANTQIYILDKDRNPLPIGAAGELYISGNGVGAGYLNRPELTAEKFIPNPFIEGKTMYCTGDLARWREDGEIEYLGRIDTQVKIRGLRIELGEIESVMSAFVGVQLAAAADKRDENGRQYLVGYYTADSKINERALRAHIAAKLPKYMVPNYFMRLDKMPMTASGKTDRKNLPVPEFSTAQTEFVSLETQTEIQIAKIWSELLKIDKISRDDDFFDLGGDSLLAITLLARFETDFNVDLSMKDIIEYSNIQAMAARLDSAKKRSATIIAHHKDKYILLPQQKTIYAICSKNPDTLTYNMPAFVSMPERVDREKIKACFKQLMNKHRVLKSFIKAENGDIYGFYDEKAELEFEEYKSDDYSAFVRPFDLSKAPLMRVAFTTDGMLVDMHHIISDGEGLNIILRDLAALYKGETVAEPEIEYSDYAEYYAGADFSAHKEYFKNMLKCDFEPIALPERREKSVGGISAIYNISKNVFDSGRDFARKNGLTDTMLYLGAFGILLSKYSAKSDILSSIILTNRIHSETANIVGMFVNTLPVMLSANGTVREYFAAVKELVLNLYEYQEQPFFEIAQAVKMDDINAVNTSFVYQADGEKQLTVGGISLAPQFIDTHTAKFDLTFELTPNENGCALRIEYNSGKYDSKLIDKLFASYVRIIEQLSAENIADINVLSKEEYQKVIYDFNDTDVEYAKDRCVHELFSKQAAKNPDKTALVFENKDFTYKQLDEMSNSLAHFLREKGIKPNDVVPIIAKRDWRIIVAMIGILKAGGAYMPVDPSYPTEHIEYMLETANSRIELSYGCSNKLNVETIDLTDFDFSANSQDIENVNSSSDLCYIIFTSGSTGKPKGVALRHSNVVNYCDNNNNNNVCHKIIKSGYESIVSVTNIVFDIFVTESLLPLVNGLTIYFANDEQVFSQQKLSELFSNSKIEVMQTTPTKMRSYILDKKNVEYLSQLKVLILGGEALPVDLYEELKKYTSAEIFNIYGPAETTVWSTNKLVESTDITIGKPIANTQVYILDRNRKPLPIGVAGELCISGDGVGAGYLNRPELTAEKFIPNPFVEGKTMYCTGDLARWREDGEIEYLGRIDTQVKIRGLRIELGEIESVMSTFTGIQLSAVTDKRDENGRQYLVGYYTAVSEIDEKVLRAHLAAKLPKYMIPNYFMRLDEMPMTASGKTDRKNLPVPQMTISAVECVAPQNELESALYRIVAEILETDQIGVTNDFFDFGGDSLRAIEYVAKAHNEGIEFTLQSVFDYPTIRELCGFIENGEKRKALYFAEDFEKFREILDRNVIDENFIPVRKSLGNVLLTGATGFLGAHILDNLMKNENGKIYCLVRSRNQDDRRGRLREILNYYFGDAYDSEIGKRIIPIIGNVEQIGLSNNIPYDVQTVIHTAATVKHYGSYEYFRNVNVFGTENVIAYAKMCRARLIHISTASVSGNSFADEFEVYHSAQEKNFDETSLYIGQPLENVYIHSKFEAEIAVLSAVLDGLDAKIVRVGNLTNRQSDFKFQPNYRENAFLTRVKAALDLGIFPDYLLPLYAEFSPIDATADGVVKIAQYAEKQNVFHLNSNKPIYFDRLLDVLHKLNIRMETVSGKEFNDTLQQLAKESKTEYIYEAFQNDMDENGQLVYDSNIRIINEFTVWFLKKTGFEWKQTDFDYIKGYIEYFRNLGYLEV